MVAKRPRHIEALAIGNELLDGRVSDTNSQRLAQALAEIGLTLRRTTTIIDDIEVIVSTAQGCIDRGADLCVVSGGLGPTSDDLTRQALAQLCGVELVRDQAWVEKLERRFAERGFAFTDNQRQQADTPQGATPILNRKGTALGFAVTAQGCRFVCVPGVPREYDGMVEDALLAPWRGPAQALRVENFQTFGLVEGEVDRRLAPVGDRWPEVAVGYRASFPEIHVTLKPRDPLTPVDASLDAAVAFASEALGKNVFSRTAQRLPEALVERLTARDETLALAESCTGGLIGDRLTDVPGSSAVLLGSMVTYANEAKVELAGVPETTLAEHGAVSEATVIAMAHGARKRLGATWGLAVSGIAGPGGGTPDKPVGTVWLALVGPGLDSPRTRRLSFPFDRRRNKIVSAHAALDLLRRALGARRT